MLRREQISGTKETGIGRVSSSPLLADGKLYLVSETAEVAVVLCPT